jgi:hypothetical protein
LISDSGNYLFMMTDDQLWFDRKNKRRHGGDDLVNRSGDDDADRRETRVSLRCGRVKDKSDDRDHILLLCGNEKCQLPIQLKR